MSSHKSLKPIGDQELALLRFVGEAGPITVGQAAERFGQARRLARSTVLTMMERLRKKGLLARKLADGVYRYRARRSSAELLQGAVERFVERHLDGSVSPFLAYLSDAPKLSDAELSELEEIVGRLKAGRTKERGAK